MPRYSWTKWAKYNALRKNGKLVRYLPETRRLNAGELIRMLRKYGKVIIKPSGSAGGNGVMQISAQPNGRYALHSEKNVKIYADINRLQSYLKQKRFRDYIVQRRIALARVNGRPFDLRIMVQRRKNTDWTLTGKLAKIAGKGYIVTNIHRSKGSVVTVKNAIQRSNAKARYNDVLMSNIDKVALQTTRQLHKYYKWIRTTGIDMGLDNKGNLWIIEVNFDPATSLFLKLKDKSMYRKIVFYQKKTTQPMQKKISV